MHADFAEIERALAAFERDVERALIHCHHHGGQPDTRPARISLTVQ